tara:strand:- start:311 stop:511 length:201 start_codon:yes stop_codon:yes gene_type:complete
MKEIFKFGDHIVAGISLYNIKVLKSYSFMITLLMIHFMIDHGDGSFRVGIGFGSDQIYVRFHVGFN